MKKLFVFTLFCLMVLAFPTVGNAAWMPNQPIKIIVSFNPGGGTDQQARLIEKEFMTEFGQPLTFIYKPGADGSIGATELKSTPADGYNIAVHTFPLIMMNTLNNKGQYKMSDFDYLAISNKDFAVLVTRKESPYDTMEKFIKAAKANPDKKLTLGVVEVLGPSHIAALKLQKLGIPLNIVTLAGGAKGMTAVLGGHIDALMTVKGASLNTASKLNFLAVASEKADEDLPNVKTFAEQGFPVQAVAARIWIAPKGLPADVKARYEESFRKIYANEDNKTKLAKAGQPVSFATGEELDKLIEEFDAEARELVEYYKSTK